MRYRALSATGDYTFGAGGANFLADSPACVGQAVLTRLRQLQGEWFLDTTDGTPYAGQVLGAGTRPTYDQVIRRRILETPGVTGIARYSSSLEGRRLSIAATIDTAYGQTSISQVLWLRCRPATG
jgi:hypothetical protein